MRARLNDSNEHIGIEFDGLMKMTEAVGKIFAGAADAKSTEFGGVWTQPRFKVGALERRGRVWLMSG